MTISAAEPILLRHVKRGRAGDRREAVACALEFDPPVGLIVETMRLAWSGRMAACFREIAAQAAASGKAEGQMLPYGTLRAAMQVQLPRAVMLARNLGQPWRREEMTPFLDVEKGDGPPAAGASAALRTWIRVVLRPWADGLGLDEGLLDAADELAAPDTAFDTEDRILDLAEAIADGEPFEHVRSAILQIVGRRLEGQELFEHLGPVYRIVRASAASNTVTFQTWPQTARRGGRYSMLATMSLETVPYRNRPVLTVRASRRRWLDTIPDPTKLRRQSRLTGCLMSDNGPKIAAEMALHVRNGVPQDPITPDYTLHALNVRHNIGASLSEMVARQSDSDSGVFIGLPYSPSTGGSHPIGAGASTRDNLDLLDAAAASLADRGFRPLEFQETQGSKRGVPKRSVEHHKAIQAEALLADVAIALGRNDLDDAALLEAFRSLMAGAEPPAIDAVAAAKAHAALEELRAANSDRVKRVFGDSRRTVVLLARTERERSTMRAVVRGLFGPSLNLVEHQLPADVHGPRSTLPKPEAKARDRFTARVEAWVPLAETLAKEYGPCHVLVQAAEWYEQPRKQKDDPVNKLAGRQALASRANANVQYLLPPRDGWRGLEHYLHRIQSAIYDLMFGHSGLVSEIGSLLETEFPDATSRPKAIIGISVVTQARLRFGADGGKICLATRVDAATGMTTARVGWFERQMRWSEWEPFFDALKRIASPELSATLGDTRDVERDSFQKFVRAVVDEAAAEGDRPFVMVDSTSAAALWPWLRDAEISKPPAIGPERVDPSSSWPGTRLVRVRTGHAGRVLERKSRLYAKVDLTTGDNTEATIEKYCPTASARTIRLSADGAAAHYWITSGYLEQIPRGLSVYRELVHFVPISKLKSVAMSDIPNQKGLLGATSIDLSEEPYRLPNAIDVTVALRLAEDDPDRLAHLMASLREGYGHTDATTTLPAPLSFESKARDYMTRFALDESDADDADETHPPDDGGRGRDSAADLESTEEDEDETAAGPAEDAPRAGYDTAAVSLPSGQTVGRWDALLRSFTSGLIGSTSLTSLRNEPLPPGVTAAARKTVPRFVMLATDAGARLQAHGESAVQADRTSDMHPPRSSVDLWSDIPREPVLPVPPFVTREWLRPKVSTSFGVLKEMHRWRDEIRDLSGYPNWPREQPTFEQFLDILVDGMRYPSFVRAATRAAIRHLGNGKKQAYILFKPFRKSSYRNVEACTGDRSVSRDWVENARQLATCGYVDDALGAMLLITLGTGPAPGFLDLARERRDELSVIIPLLEAADKYMSGKDFEWQRDVVEQRTPYRTPSSNSPAQPMDTPALPAPAATAESDPVPTADIEPAPLAADPEKRPEAEAPVASQTEHEPAASPGIVSDTAGALVASLASWDRLMDEVSHAAAAAVGLEPDPALLEQLQGKLTAATAAWQEWEAARPKHVDAAELVHSIRDEEAALTELLKTHPALASVLDVITHVSEAARQDAAKSLEAARECAKAAASANSEAAALWHSHDFSKAGQIAELHGRTQALALEGMEHLRKAAEALAAGAVAPSHTSADVVLAVEPRPAAPTEVAADAPQDEDVEDDAALELAMETEAVPAAADAADEAVAVSLAPEKAPQDAAAETEPDPFALSVERKLAELFGAGSFGLAFHLLRAAKEVFPDHPFGFSEPELRLAAMTRHINHASMQGAALVTETLVEIADGHAVFRGESSRIPQDVTTARHIILYAACAPLALFQSASPAVAMFEKLEGICPDLDDAFRLLRAALVDAAHSGMTVTPATMRTANAETTDDDYAEKCRLAAIAKTKVISELRFPFYSGTKVRIVLARNEGEIGTLKASLEKGGKEAIEAARGFSENFGERSRILGLIADAESRANTRKSVDGAARERLASKIGDLASLCAEFVQASEAAPVVRASSRKAVAIEIRDKVAAGVDRAMLWLSTFASASDSLTTAAAKFALEALEHLKDAVHGRYVPPGIPDHLLAVHGPLLWLEGLHFGRSWFPSPYQPERIVDIILRLRSNPVPEPSDATDGFRAAVRKRLEEGSFIAARLLIETGGFFGAPEDVRVEMQDEVDGNTETRRGALEHTLDDTKRRVDRVQRMGGLASHDESQRLMSLLERVIPSKLPDDVSLDNREEVVDKVGSILDFRSAESLIEDVQAKLKSLLDVPRKELLRRLDRVTAAGKAQGTDVAKIRGIIERDDDLLTASEWVGFLESGRGLPEHTSPNPRLHEFFPAVPKALASVSRDGRDGLNRAIREFRDFGPLRFSRIAPARRDDVAELYEAWSALKRYVDGGRLTDNVVSTLTHFLGLARLSEDVIGGARSRSIPKRKTYFADMRLKIAQDAESVLLPDFGSLIGGAFRICVVSKMPSGAEIAELCEGHGSLGVIVLVTDIVDAERRRQLATNLIKENRRLLVIDEAIFLYALSEPEFRPLTMFECAQAFSFATPYKDYGNQAVPPEMFFGREAECRKIFEPFGSCIVYGGRRLGKTALLQHVKSTRDDPGNGVVVAYVNILSVGSSELPSRIWYYASRQLQSVFPDPVSTASDFAAKVRAWLEVDTRRRILVLFDESDRFIEEDAKDSFQTFIALQELMDSTARRFKMVLAGLHNVTRLVHTENPPLKQIAADPLRIGPLMDKELRDAELLITRPLAAMGYEFENRGDVWRILSHCNYYPVLLQTFCEGLLEDLHKQIERKRQPIPLITGDMVRRALDSEEISRTIGEKFDYTISKIDPRYELIAYIMADQALTDLEAGRVDEGMSAVEIVDQATEYWPAAFSATNRLSIVEDLLDEMEGLGVLRRMPGDGWALRSHAILRLLGSKERVGSKLYNEFVGRQAPSAFEPRSMRRPVHLGAIAKVPEGYLCPLTLGQEHDLFSKDGGAAHVRLVFGSGLSDVGIVGAALAKADTRLSDGTWISITSRIWPTIETLVDAIRSARVKEGERALFVVDAKADWKPSWVEQILRARAVEKGRIRVAFVGGPEHALAWVADSRFSPLPPQIRVIPLQSWSNALVDHEVSNKTLMAPDQFRDELRKVTGGFNAPMCSAVGLPSDKPDKFTARLKRFGEELLAKPGLLDDLGLVPPMRDVYRRMAEYMGKGTRITLYEISEDALANVPAANGFTREQVADFGVLMGLLEPEPFRPGDGEDARSYVMNPLVAAALRLARTVETVA